MAPYNDVAQRELEDAPRLPLAASHVWAMFQELEVTRTSNGFGVNPTSWAELFAYEQMTRTKLTMQEIGLLRALDMERLAHLSKRTASAQPAPAPPPLPPLPPL